MDKCLVLFVEGPTDEEFYRQLIALARTMTPNGRFDFSIEIKDMYGVGNFKQIVLRKFEKEVKKKHGSNCHYIIALCRDTDVFEGFQHPMVNWNNLAKEFKKRGAEKVIHIKANHSIEDWFLYDLDGIITYLKLPKDTKVSGENGYEKLEKLFRLANKIYYKGMRSKDLIEHLDINKIACNVRNELGPLYNELGIYDS